MEDLFNNSKPSQAVRVADHAEVLRVSFEFGPRRDYDMLRKYPDAVSLRTGQKASRRAVNVQKSVPAFDYQPPDVLYTPQELVLVKCRTNIWVVCCVRDTLTGNCGLRYPCQSSLVSASCRIAFPYPLPLRRVRKDQKPHSSTPLPFQPLPGPSLPATRP